MTPARGAREQERASATEPELRGWLALAARCLLAASVICRFLTPTDGVTAGETIWVAQLALLGVAVWAAAVFRSGSLRLEFDWIDGAALLLVAGHVVGALAILADSGDKRAALTMLWEWCGIAATYFLMRRLLVSSAERRHLLLAVAATAATLSALGVWQHYFGYAESRREYEKVKAQYDSLMLGEKPADPAAALEWERSLQRVRADFVRMNVPGEDGARMMWEQRLNSSEPFAMFALANTLAGLLACSTVIWLAALTGAWRVAPRWQIVLGAAAQLLILYCLLLTKSRTAFAGMLAGLAVWVSGSAMLAHVARHRLALWIGAALVGVAVLIGLAAATGGLDRFVVSESAKSLRYRFEYWQGTWRLLTASPRNTLLGVGPGNFRPNYLAFKLPQSSEEVADPHNLVLDVWANGGVLSLLGLAGLCIAGLRPIWRQAAPPAADKARPRLWSDGILTGAALAHLAVLVPGGASEETIILLLFGWLCLVGGSAEIFRTCLRPAAYAGAFAALAVHLLGAGGIAMPAISQLLLLFVVFGTATNRPAAWHIASASRAGGFVAATIALALYFGCWFTGLIPIVSARAAISSGRQEFFELGRAGPAEREFRHAAQADPYAAEPCELLAQVAFQRWLGQERMASKEFERAAEWQREAIARNPRLSVGHRALGEMYLAKFARTGNLADAAEAAKAFQAAVELYPNFALGQAELAEALWKEGAVETARASASRALELDRINEQAKHIDKQLPAERRKLMEEIVAGHRAPPRLRS